MPMSTGVLAALAALADRLRGDDPERGDVPGFGYPSAGAGCDAAGGYAPTLARGEEFSVCVTVTVRIPLLPEFVDANTATGQFLVERDRYVDP